MIYFIIVFLEGFTTLSVEILAIRRCVSVIGSNSITTSIILGVILVALSYGYYIGGKIASNSSKEKIIKRLFINLFISGLIYTLISFPLENIVLTYLLNTGIGYALSILIAIFLLFFVPVFLASQTIPLLNELIDSEKKSELVGKLLFYSTIGSFIGSITTSLVLFPYLGVSKTIILNGIILLTLSLIIIIINKKSFKDYILIINLLLLVIFGKLILSNIFDKNYVYSFDSSHNDIDIIDYEDNKRIMLLNGAFSSGIYKENKESYFTYIIETQNIIKKLKPKNILVVGGAGFSLPYYVSKLDFIDSIDVSEIDVELYNISQKYFLEEKLNDKVNFYGIPAEYLVNQKLKEGKKYDFIFIDAYTGKSVPSQLLTKEFYDGLNKISSGAIVFNYIFDQNNNSTYYKKTVNTLSNSLGSVYLKGVSEFVGEYGNFLVINKEYKGFKKIDRFKDLGIYTDDKGTQEIDKYMLFKDNY
ncbi:MAG: fused MFS/spermidine synthase [Candidatus Gracilibacteria bacterium]|nr:fused MFS/spermidine synthase [Candidatus Gracilibacteria bacterium]